MRHTDAILKNGYYQLNQFSKQHQDVVEQRIEMSDKGVPYVKCLVRNRLIKLTPEEIVRQLCLLKLTTEYKYPLDRIKVEVPIQMGSSKDKKADIVIYYESDPTAPYIIVELKKPKLLEGKAQLKSYCAATGAPIGMWTNGNTISFYHRVDTSIFEDLSNIPDATQELNDLINEPWYISTLIEKDKLSTECKSLKDLMLELEDEVLANSGEDAFEEVFKLIFTKLYDELESTRDINRILKFRNNGESDNQLKNKIQALLEDAIDKWEGVFDEGTKINLTGSHLAVCVASLQNVKLFNSNLEVIDDAFEHLVNKSSKGEKGQYFTPRYVIDMCVKMLNPTEQESMIDTAAGSCGFPVHTIFHVWKQIYADLGKTADELFTAEEKEPRALKYVQNKVFGIDFDPKTVRVARTLNLIAGDGHTNVLNLNSLYYPEWSTKASDTSWLDVYHMGWKNLRKLRSVKEDDRNFKFDIVMANPPFAGDIKEEKILHLYDLAKDTKGKVKSKVSRDVLFIERNIDFLKPGGRMAIVLPQGIFNNASDSYIRNFIAEKCRILAVVGLHGNVFKPHTGTKTSVLFVQKWDKDLCPKVEDYPIFFATMQKPSKNNSGHKIYIQNELGAPILDSHEHLVVDHDLFSQEMADGKHTPSGIAEAFIEFAQRENLSFV